MLTYRTTAAAVQAVLGDNYGAKVDGSLPDVTTFIGMANPLIDRVVQIAAQKISPIVLSTAEQEVLERLMAAHFYCLSDPIYTSRNTSSASGQFQVGTPDEGFGATEYGRQAMAFDYSGCLKQLSLKRRAAATWLGKPVSAQIPYVDRNYEVGADGKLLLGDDDDLVRRREYGNITYLRGNEEGKGAGDGD